MQKIKVNDEVIILAGKDRGKSGKVKKILKKKNRIIVDGLNLLKKTIRPTQESPSGGIIDKEGSLHISNVSLISQKTKKATRVRIENKSGKNTRVLVSCGTMVE